MKASCEECPRARQSPGKPASASPLQPRPPGSQAWEPRRTSPPFLLQDPLQAPDSVAPLRPLLRPPEAFHVGLGLQPPPPLSLPVPSLRGSAQTGRRMPSEGCLVQPRGGRDFLPVTCPRPLLTAQQCIRPACCHSTLLVRVQLALAGTKTSTWCSLSSMLRYLHMTQTTSGQPPPRLSSAGSTPEERLLCPGESEASSRPPAGSRYWASVDLQGHPGTLPSQSEIRSSCSSRLKCSQCWSRVAS